MDEKKITSREEDFSQWYLDVIKVSDFVEHGPVRGTMIIKPYGYAIWENIKKEFDKRIKATGVENASFPLFIPNEFLHREAKHVEGFSPEVVAVTHAGGEELKEPFVIRPTSETIIYDAYSRWVESYKDLPILINQWANVVRWELRPRLLLRSTEFLWQEGHTAHATPEEADERAQQMLLEYKKFAEEILAIPVFVGKKTDSERFAGADITYTTEAMMQDGKALQFATSHNLGDKFAKAFNIKFVDENGDIKYCYQTSWGMSTRSLGGLIMVHSDDSGLVVPPKVAPYEVVIIPVWPKPEDREMVDKEVEKLQETLEKDFRVKVDDTDLRVGEKFYKWEKKGAPLRLEIGPRDIKEGHVVLARRDTGEKVTVKMEDLTKEIKRLLEDIQQNLFDIAKKRMDENTVRVETYDAFKKAIEESKFVLGYWVGDSDDEAKLKEETMATVRCFPFEHEDERGKCFYTGKDGAKLALFARSY
ncbi:proline--tRNA ligase [Candidatus Dojkabacteria bacterium]|jgi:prolyl-tRNA synthetase|nr:proline--tRNA ligase [Candidatus Dojkabacteria bacterium]